MPRKHTDHKKVKVDPNALICKPLDTYSEIMLFLENPPPWRALCEEMTPHSSTVIRNVEINKHYSFRTLETPEHFCHFDRDSEEPRRVDPKSLRKTLVCHDMANGYHDDCIIDGTANSEAYTFYNWAGIDIFCYFSHHLITIPPVSWINVGHAHGVKVIGTVITEWAEGITFWEQVLASETEYQNLASALVAIAKTLKFDGYLLNVENKISKPDVLLEFVKYLHRLLHEELEHAVLIWYDSVTIQGNLNWQNGLNEKNKAFFDACDGFFTNYSWSIDNVVNSAALADERVTDLYIGIDVWGRNFYGGGQFNTHEAIKVAHASGCSLAIFAPAWTHEALTSEKSDSNHVAMAEDLDWYGQFLLRDRAFWGSIWPFFNTRVPCRMPFQTSFCRGHGKKRRLYGEVLSPSPWYNLRHQQYQPNAAHGPHGYLLTTAEKLVKVSRAAQLKDKKGIIRYRTSFQMSRAELHAVNKEAIPFTSSTESVKEEDGDTTDSVTKSDEESKAVKKTTMNPFKNLFKQKLVKASDDESKLTSRDESKISAFEGIASRDELEAGSSLVTASTRQTEGTRETSVSDGEYTRKANEPALAGPSSAPGLSMMRMSVNLRLGANAEKTRYCLAHVAEERECLQLYLDDSFTGGACLKVNPSDRLCPEHRFTRLFYCDFLCEDTLLFCVVTKTLHQYADQSLNVNLFMRNAHDEDLTVVLTGRDVAQTKPLDSSATGIKYVYPLCTRTADVLRQLRTYLLINEPGFYVPMDNCYGWTVRYYEVSVPGSRISSINLRTGLPQGGVLLGHFGVCRKRTAQDLMGT